MTVEATDAVLDVVTDQELYCQWLTPPTVAAAFMQWANIEPSDVLVEPAAGEGALIPHAHAQVLAFEIDPDRIEVLRAIHPQATALCADFLKIEPPAIPSADVAVMNPPYTAGGEGVFVDQALKWAPRVCALVRADALHGKQRYALCWGNGVKLSRIAFFVYRPRFLGPFGVKTPHPPKRDYIAIEAYRDGSRGLLNTEVSWVDWR